MHILRVSDCLFTLSWFSDLVFVRVLTVYRGSDCTGKSVVADGKGIKGKPVKNLKDWGMNDGISSFRCTPGVLEKKDEPSAPALIVRQNIPCTTVHLYADPNFRGNYVWQCAVPNICYYLPPELNDKVSSLTQINGFCRFYK